MRYKLAILAAAVLFVAGCNRDGAEDANAVAERGMTAEAITANDVTAIDAVTGSAANMAADVEITNLPTNAADSAKKPGKPRSRARPIATQPAETSATPATEPAAESAGNTQ